MDKKVVWILGLNHSGTTIVWKSFRKNTSLTAFDEPLVSNIGYYYPNNNNKKTFDEYLYVFESPREFWKTFSPIYPLQELDERLTSCQIRYLEYLLQHGKKVIVIDETHLHFKLPCIDRISRDGRIVHLVRRARGFVTSHLLPSRAGIGIRHNIMHSIRKWDNRYRFWKRLDMPPAMARDIVIGDNPYSKFGLILKDSGYDVEKIMTAPAVVRMLAYWHYCYHRLEKQGPKIFGDRFTTLWYEDFANDPAGTMNQLYDWLGMKHPQGIIYDDVHPPKPPFRPSDKRWVEAARIAGFTDTEIDTLL